ncbi:aspartate--tRNA ligase, partial [Candidatus Woesearchaeota archaeon]|nr:aspartate--tRNA ligase [Candidatus Woesearchaeota archaeon]
MLRTHTCGELRKKDIGKKVELAGWVQAYRDHGGVIFIDLRDRYGLTQIVFDPSHDKKVHTLANSLRREWVIRSSGKVRFRGKGLVNPKLDTGEIEILADSLEILNKSEAPPFEINDNLPNEDLRLKYRYLDLRRPDMQSNLETRHKVITATRQYLNENGFLEIETPMLAKSTPEGARDYLVPSRVNMGKFYALPQSPQLYKQILMISGMDKYYQIARCLRDEDLRADRQPEFTQIDLEMSFVEPEDIYVLVEGMLKKIWKNVLNVNIQTPFPRITYDEAIDRYGCDRPDTRFGMELINVTETMTGSEFKVFEDVIKAGGCIKCINVKNSGFSRNDIDSFIEFVKIYDAKGLAWMRMAEKLESSITKFFSDAILKKVQQKTKAEKGDLLLIVADKKHKIVNDALSALRLKLGKDLGMLDRNKYNFLWVIDFPMVEYDENEQRHVAVHHPFTSARPEDMNYLEKDPERVRARAYDVVLNGWELGGGSIRIHDPEVQRAVFKTIGLSKKEAEDRFGFLLEAFKYGAPPHGGLALGVDRVIAMITQSESIRDVIAFPKNKNAEELMVGSPSDVD